MISNVQTIPWHWYSVQGPRFVLGRKNVPCVAEVVSRSLKADCTDFTMARTKGLSLICEIPNFADAYLGKVTKFQGYGLFRFGVLSNLLRWKTTPLPPYE